MDTQRQCISPARRPKVIISPQIPSVMQSVRPFRNRWTIRFEPLSAPFVEPLMGWIGTEDTLHQVLLNFSSKDKAIAFAQRHGWEYSVEQPPRLQLKPKSYADNFRRAFAPTTPHSRILQGISK